MNIANRKDLHAVNEKSDTVANSIEAVANIYCVLYDHLGKLEQYQGNRQASFFYRYTAHYSQMIKKGKFLGIAQLTEETMPSIANMSGMEIMWSKVKCPNKYNFSCVIKHRTSFLIFLCSVLLAAAVLYFRYSSGKRVSLKLLQELWSEEVKVILNEMWVFFYFFTEMNMINRKE